MRPLFQQPSELTSAGSSPPRSSQIPQPPSVGTSRSSTSLRPQPTILSLHSSQDGSGFVPSRHSSPVISQKGSSPSKSTSTSTSWNLFARKLTPSSDLKFIPESTVEEDFFPCQTPLDKDLLDMRNTWALVEDRKREDQLLRMECGWGSQSGPSASQVSAPQMCQSVGAVRYCPDSQGEIIIEGSQIWPRMDEFQEFDPHEGEYTSHGLEHVFPARDSKSLEELPQSPPPAASLLRCHKPLSPMSFPTTATSGAQALPGEDTSNGTSKDEENESILQETQYLNKSILHVVEENASEDEGIPWF